MPAIESELSRRVVVAAGLAGVAALAAAAAPAISQDRSQPMQTTIRATDELATQVNVFTVEPEDQPKLVQLLKEGTEGFFSKKGGWISTNLLSSKDGRRVIVYSQWRSLKDIDAFRQDPNFGPYFKGIAAIAKNETISCDVAWVLHV